MFRSVFNTFFPETCVGCDHVLQQDEEVVCTTCLHYLPIIGKQETAANHIKPHFYGHLEVENAASLMFYHKKGMSQRLLHHLKYRGREEVSTFLGDWFATKFQKEAWLKALDIVIPVPLHIRRKRKRGYNQVAGFAKIIAERFHLQYAEDVLIKTFNSQTQVFKNRLSRTELKTSYFKLKAVEKIKNKQVLLVDDIITTGATLETCARILLAGKPKSISIATMAITM